MLTYAEWKKIKDWVEWILDAGSFLIEGAIELGLAEFGIVPPFSTVIAWLVTKAIKWGVGWLLDLIPHEAERGIGYHAGNVRELRNLGDEPPTVAEIKETAKAIPLVPLRIPAKPVPEIPPKKTIPLAPLEDSSFATPGVSYPDPTKYTREEIKETDAAVEQFAAPKLQKTFPWITRENPVPGAPLRGFTDPAKAFTRSIRLYS